eukprot:Lithocolla_globosa_v1_NODE_259_length_4780_cov_16.351111.p5 type:complete len:112 gc:universal NODE_259_length_4780_cov_16.351111:2821-3156(+)
MRSSKTQIVCVTVLKRTNFWNDAGAYSRTAPQISVESWYLLSVPPSLCLRGFIVGRSSKVLTTLAISIVVVEAEVSASLKACEKISLRNGLMKSSFSFTDPGKTLLAMLIV